VKEIQQLKTKVKKYFSNNEQFERILRHLYNTVLSCVFLSWTFPRDHCVYFDVWCCEQKTCVYILQV